MSMSEKPNLKILKRCKHASYGEHNMDGEYVYCSLKNEYTYTERITGDDDEKCITCEIYKELANEMFWEDPEPFNIFKKENSNE